jgi:hypothetical protein
MVFRKKKKGIQELVVGDFVKEKSVTKTRKRCGEVLMILQDSTRDPTVECVEVDPEELTHLTKGSEGLKSFKTKRSNLKFYTPRRQLFTKKVFEKGDVVSYKKKVLSNLVESFASFILTDCIQNHTRRAIMEKIC